MRLRITSFSQPTRLKQPDGSMDFVLNNKNAYSSVTVAVKPARFLSQATTLLLTAPSLTSTSGFTLGGSQIEIDGSWTSTLEPDGTHRGWFGHRDGSSG